MMVTLGVTGGIGSGKTTACQFLAEQGAYIFNADQVAKQILLTDEDVQEEIETEFGTSIRHNNQVDTQKLARIAFASEENQTTLNNILHPLVIENYLAQVEKQKDDQSLFVVDAPLIFESGFDGHLDYTALIYTKYKIRLSRAIQRGTLSREQILKRMELQMPDEEKRELANFVIENNGTIADLKQRMQQLYDELVS